MNKILHDLLSQFFFRIFKDGFKNYGSCKLLLVPLIPSKVSFQQNYVSFTDIQNILEVHPV